MGIILPGGREMRPNREKQPDIIFGQISSGVTEGGNMAYVGIVVNGQEVKLSARDAQLMGRVLCDAARQAMDDASMVSFLAMGGQSPLEALQALHSMRQFRTYREAQQQAVEQAASTPPAAAESDAPSEAAPSDQ